MVGAIAANLHEGGRSELLADYFFSTLGTVTPVRRSDDYGVDLYCTLTERLGQRARVREYFTVQVKSNEEPWAFDDAESVKWLIEHPNLLFFCTVSNKHLRVRVYHVFPRFYAWALGVWPPAFRLTPGEGKCGVVPRWKDGSSFSLSAPVIEAGIRDLTDETRLNTLKKVFSQWVDFDRENCDLVRQGLPRFRMPNSYVTNELSTEVFEGGLAEATRPDVVNRGLLRLAEALECLGGLQGNMGDRAFALEAAILLDRIQKEHSSIFGGKPYLQKRVSGMLGEVVNRGLNKALGHEGPFFYARLEHVENAIMDIPRRTNIFGRIAALLRRTRRPRIDIASFEDRLPVAYYPAASHLGPASGVDPKQTVRIAGARRLTPPAGRRGAGR
jgi:hypothetical protein